MSDSGLSHSISDIELSKIEESAADFARQAGNILFKYFNPTSIGSGLMKDGSRIASAGIIQKIVSKLKNKLKSI